MGKSKFKIDTKDFQLKMKKLQNDYPEFNKTIIQKIGSRVLATVKRKTPVKTGHLRKNWSLTKPQVDKNGASIEVYNPVKYGPYVELGHKTKGGKFIQGKLMLKSSLALMQERIKLWLDTEIQKFIDKHE